MKTRKYFGILLCLFAFLLFGVSHVNAALPSSDDIVDNVSTQKIELSEGVEFYARNDLTAQNGQIETTKRPQHDQAIVVPKTSEAVDIVVWSAGSDDKWSAATLRSTIADFERRNPGYRVIAGVNGDFFDINETFQPTNSMVSAGDVWKKDTVQGGTVVGIKADKSYITGMMTTDNFMSLKLLDGKVVTDSFKVDKINSMPADDTQLALFYPGSGANLNVAGYTVYAGNYDIYRVSKAGSYVVNDPLGSFLKGHITEVRNDIATISSIGDGEFYLVSKNSDVATKLTANTEIKCEYSLNGAWADVQNAIGTNMPLVKDGQLVAQTNKDVHPRTMLGIRADGSFVLMTVDGRQPIEGANGITYIEGGALLQEMDCVQGYNLDGGGSTTSFIRDAAGKLQLMNWPSDGGERSLGNTILVVARDPKIAVTDVGSKTFTIGQTEPIVDGTIQNVQVKLSGGEYQPLVNNTLTFSDLEKDSDYTVYYTYEILDDFEHTIHSAENKMTVHTLAGGIPEVEKFRFGTKTGTTAAFNYEIIADELTNITAKYIAYGDNRKFDLPATSGQVEITDLEPGTDYVFELVIEYDLNGTIKTLSGGTLTYTTAPVQSKKGCLSGISLPSALLTLASFAAAGAFLVIRRRG